MSKAPPKIPTSVGQKVRLRGRGGDGEVLQITPRQWVEVAWKPIKTDAGILVQPRICHAFELELA